MMQSTRITASSAKPHAPQAHRMPVPNRHISGQGQHRAPQRTSK